MNYWEHIPLHQNRPQTDGNFSAKKQLLLEDIISAQVADVLSDYGRIEEVKIDVGTSQFGETKSYFGLFIPKIPLRHNGSLLIGQFPWYSGDSENNGYFGTEEGLYSFSVKNQQNQAVLEAAIWHPYIETDHRISDSSGKPLSFSVLHEMYDALTVTNHQLALLETVSSLSCHRARNFPIAVVEPEVEFIVIDYNQN